jgi:predicted adenylyl cyclase CyaB
MSRNIEIKARIESIAALLPKVAALADREPIEIHQDDTFFTCAQGRLKLRAFSEREGELIFYRRENQAGPKESFYVIAPTAEPDLLRDVLTLAYGQAGRVRKHRILYLIDRTRVHLDSVEELGEFLELEVVLGEDESSESGMTEAHRLMQALGVDHTRLIDCAYVDLPAATLR